jgi:hypothetical protein
MIRMAIFGGEMGHLARAHELDDRARSSHQVKASGRPKIRPRLLAVTCGRPDAIIARGYRVRLDTAPSPLEPLDPELANEVREMWEEEEAEKKRTSGRASAKT